MSVQALQGQLRTLRSIIEDLPDDLFKAKISQASGSVGEHVRHALDHARALLALTDGDDLTYDARLRGTPVETHSDVAACEIGRVCGDLEQLAAAPPERPICLHLIAEAGRRPTQLTSTLGREIGFVVQHTIHHCALIALLLERRGITTPARFGYAPSTPARS
jgi:uncharacterized damage-inducible protein DinB